MQFHHHGYVSGDPRVLPPQGSGLTRTPDLPDETDVLIVGAGPAGMLLAAQLSRYPGVSTRLIERRAERLMVGQADGIQPRSMETFQAFGFAERILAEAFQRTATSFWGPDPVDPGRIVRTKRLDDDASAVTEFPRAIVNQARVLDYLAEYAADGPARITPDYGYEFVGLQVSDDPAAEHPVAVTVRHTVGEQAGAERTVHARYVVGCDGARSAVRSSIGRSLTGEQAFHAWGVMDILAVTDFPDFRIKCTIQSATHGTIITIPREGGFLVRMYVDLGEVSPDDGGAVRNTTTEQIIARAGAILAPYTLDVRHVAWSSVYEVAHRLTDRFDDVPADRVGVQAPRVFIAGDACHTHSAKAGQGMNVSMQDAFNLGWKLGQVIEGRSPAALLSTYSEERQVIAQNLIDFDREWSTMVAKKPEDFASPAELEDFYRATSEFPAGFLTQYRPSMITDSTAHQSLAAGFPVGKRFKSAHVTRVADAIRVHLGHHHRADGRWRIYAFAGIDSAELTRWAQWLAESPDSPVRSLTPVGADADAVFDVKVVYRQTFDIDDLPHVPRIFRPLVGPFQIVDHEKVYAADPIDDIFVDRAIADIGAVVVVRPDQYVAAVLPLTATRELGDFFARSMRRPVEESRTEAE